VPERQRNPNPSSVQEALRNKDVCQGRLEKIALDKKKKLLADTNSTTLGRRKKFGLDERGVDIVWTR
jgi:hypothetical protein